METKYDINYLDIHIDFLEDEKFTFNYGYKDADADTKEVALTLQQYRKVARVLTNMAIRIWDELDKHL